MITIAICEDENYFRADLQEKIEQFLDKKHEFYRIFSYESGEALLNETTSFNLIFLDIKLKNMDGVEVARSLRSQGKQGILIFITAFQEYVYDAFDVEAFHYLLKPLKEEKLFSVLEKALVRLKQSEGNILTVKKGYTITKVDFSNIMYFEVIDRKIYIHTKYDILDYYEKMDVLEKQLSKDFFRCHRSYIVNFQFVKSYENNFACMDNGDKIPVSKSFRVHFSHELLRFLESEVY